MESTPREVIVLTTTLKDAGPGYDMTTGELTNHYIAFFGVKLWLGKPCGLHPGDRVRITIQKEPDDDRSARRSD